MTEEELKELALASRRLSEKFNDLSDDEKDPVGYTITTIETILDKYKYSGVRFIKAAKLCLVKS